MAEIAITDVVTTISLQDMDYSPQGRVKSFPTIAFGNGTLKYDTYGIPVPDFRKLGMKKVVKRLRIDQPPDGYDYRYDPTVRATNPVAPYGTIRIFQSNTQSTPGLMPLVELGNVTVPATVLNLEVIGQ
jgi:hypothetical protein